MQKLVNEVQGTTFDELSNSGEYRFHQLDAMLAMALVQMKDPHKQPAMRIQRKKRCPQAQRMR